MKKPLLSLLFLITSFQVAPALDLPFEVQYIDRCSYYIQASGGWNFWYGKNDTIFTHDTDVTQTLLRPYQNYLANIAVGALRGPIRLEVEGTYRKPDRAELVLSTAKATCFGQVAEYSLMGNFLYDFALRPKVHLSFGGGLGVARTELAVKDTAATIEPLEVSEIDYRFAFQAIAGITIHYNENFSVFAQYKLFGSNSPQVFKRDISTGTVTLNGRDVPLAQSLEAGIRLTM